MAKVKDEGLPDTGPSGGTRGSTLEMLLTTLQMTLFLRSLREWLMEKGQKKVWRS